MNHYTELDPYVIRARNEQIREEVRSLRLEGRLRKSRSPRRPRLSALVKRVGVRDLIGRSRWRAITSVLLAFVAALAALALATPSTLAAGGKPDLVVTSAKLTSRNYVFSGKNGTFSFADTTKNRDDATAPARISKTALKLRPNDSPPGWLVAGRTVPALNPGRSDSGSGSRTFAVSNNSIGVYYAVVCADAKRRITESNERNNCKGTGKLLHVIPERWTGSVTGSVPVMNGVTETWSAQNVTFEFSPSSSTLGFFRYEATGDVTYSVSGTDQWGCTWSGSGTATLANHGDLIVSEGFIWYDGFDRIAPFYTVTRTCPNGGGSSSVTGPINSNWFDTGRQKPIANPVGVTSLKGTYDYVSTAGDVVHYSWDLTAN
jgi:hypothetical protein